MSSHAPRSFSAPTLLTLALLGGTAHAEDTPPPSIPPSAPPPAAAQPPAPSDSSADRVHQLELRLDALERGYREAQRKLEEKSAGDAKGKAPSNPAVPLTPVLGTNWRDGFVIQSADSAFRLRVGGLVQVDGRYFPANTATGPVDQFLLRRARIDVEATAWKYVTLRVLPDFAGGKITLFDAYVDIAFFPWLRLRAGKFKVPFSLERLQAAANTAFMERGFASDIAPNRDLGVQVSGEIASGTINYAIGVFNGNVDNSTNDSETDDDKELAARLFFHPFRPTKLTPLHNLGIGGAYSYGQSKGSVASPNLPIDRDDGQLTYFQYVAGTTVDDTALSAGVRQRASAQAYFYYWRLGLFGEYTWNRQDVRRKIWREPVERQAWTIYASILLTDDKASFGGVKPARPLDFGARGPGAWELALRYTELVVGESAFAAHGTLDNGKPDPTSLFADPTRSARSARAFSAGLNWYINANARFILDFTRTDFQGGAKTGDRAAENLIAGRLQMSL